MKANKVFFIKKISTANILNGGKLKAFTLGSGKRQEYPFSLLLFKVHLEVLSLCNNIRKGKNRYADWKGEIKLYLFTDDMTVYTENLKELTPPQKKISWN